MRLLAAPKSIRIYFTPLAGKIRKICPCTQVCFFLCRSSKPATQTQSQRPQCLRSSGERRAYKWKPLCPMAVCMCNYTEFHARRWVWERWHSLRSVLLYAMRYIHEWIIVSSRGLSEGMAIRAHIRPPDTQNWRESARTYVIRSYKERAKHLLGS